MNVSYTLNILKFSIAKKFGIYRAKFDSVCRSRYFFESHYRRIN